MTTEEVKEQLEITIGPLRRIFDLAINNPHATIHDRGDIEEVRRTIIYVEKSITNEEDD